MSSFSTPPSTRSFTRATATTPAESEQLVPGSSFFDVLDTYRKWGSTSLVFQKFMASGYEPDPDFEIDDTLWKDLTYNVPPDLWDSYSDATSLKHALHISEINRIVSEKRNTLANAGGVTSFTGPIVGQFLDPANVALGIITGTSGPILRMGLGARAVTLGTMNAAASGAITAAESSVDPSVTGMDVARSVVGGAGFGAASGAFGTSGRLVRGLTGAAGQALPPAAIDLFDDRPGNLKAVEFASNLLFGGVFNAVPGPDATPERVRAAEILDTVGKRMIAQAEGRTIDAPTPIPDIVRRGMTATSDAPTPAATTPSNFGMGAAGTLIPDVRVPTDPRSLDLTGRVPQLVGNDAAVSALSQRIRVGSFDFGIARWDMTGLAAASEVPEIRLAASLLGDDALLPVDGSPRQISAAAWVASRIAESENAVVWAEKESLASFNAEQKSNGVPWRQRTSATDFQRMVTKALREGIPEGTNPHVAKAAQAYRKQYDDIVALAKDHGISIEYAKNYVNRHHIADAREARALEIGQILDPQGSRGMQRAAGLNVLRDFFASAQESDAIKNGVQITPELQKQFVENADSIIAKAGVGSFVDDSTGASLGTGQNRTVSRIKLDETFQQTVQLGNGKSVTLNVSDFLEDNIAVLFHLYTRQMHGLMALSRVGELLGVKINPDDGSPIEGINSILKALEDRAIERGTPRERYLSDLKRVKSILHIVGQIPEHATNGWTRTLDFLRNVNVIQYMANFGTAIQNLGSIADTIAISGASNTFKAMFPSIQDIADQVKGRKINRRQAIEIMEMGIGMERLTRRVMPQLGENLDAPVGRTRVELMAAKGAKAMLDWSGQTFAQDLASIVQARAFNYNLDDMARTGQYFSDRRLAVMGLDRNSLGQVLDEFKKNAIATDGKPLYQNGKRRAGVDLDHLALDKWDGEIRETYRNAMWMEYQRVIQPGSPTQMPWFFNTPVGKVLSQFRTFAFQAHLNRVLSELQIRDGVTVKRYIYSTAAAALIYIGRTYLDAAVRDDRDEFLERRLSGEELWQAAFSRAAYSGMFPTFWDTLWSDMLGNDPTFSFARTTELSGGALFGSPTAQRLKELGAPMIGDGDLIRLPKALGRAATGEPSQQDWRTIKAGVPIPDLFNLRKVMDNWARENLPSTNQ